MKDREGEIDTPTASDGISGSLMCGLGVAVGCRMKHAKSAC